MDEVSSYIDPFAYTFFLRRETRKVKSWLVRSCRDLVCKALQMPQSLDACGSNLNVIGPHKLIGSGTVGRNRLAERGVALLK